MERNELLEGLIEKWNVCLVNDGSGRIYGHPSKKDIQEWEKYAPEIKVYLKEKDAEKMREIEARQAKIYSIEGLKEIEDAQKEWDQYRYKYNKVWESGDSRFPSAPQTNVKELHQKYPRASAYLTADAWTDAADYRKAAAGKRAKERIINGEDYAQVIADMKKEYSDSIDPWM